MYTISYVSLHIYKRVGISVILPRTKEKRKRNQREKGKQEKRKKPNRLKATV
jgi:hypothetical protein